MNMNRRNYDINNEKEREKLNRITWSEVLKWSSEYCFKKQTIPERIKTQQKIVESQ